MPMVMPVRATRLEFGRRAAAVGGLAACGFKLNRCVGDVKAIAEGAVEAFENAAALRHRHLCDGDMTGEGMRLRAETPHMQVVNVHDAFDCSHGSADFAKLKVARGSFEQDVQGLANNSHGTPQNHPGDQDRKHWLDPGHAAEQDRGATCYYCGRRQGASELAQKDPGG